MTDQSRPRPQYGEYATPEEQAKAIRTRRSDPEGHGAPPAPRAPAPVGVPLVRRHGQANRIVTIVLLGLGLINVLGSAPSYLDFPSTLQTVYNQVGIGTYTAVGLARTLGIVAVVSQGVLWLATAALSGYLLKRRRLAWWVPLVGGAISVIAVMIIMYIAMFSDPALSAYLESLR